MASLGLQRVATESSCPTQTKQRDKRGAARDKTGTAGTKQGEPGTKQGQTGTKHRQSGTKQGQSIIGQTPKAIFFTLLVFLL